MLAVGLIVVGAFGLGFLFWYDEEHGGPSMEITNVDGAKHVDLRYVGEYCRSVTRIKLLRSSDREVVWEIYNSRGALCELVLTPGENRVDQPGTESYRVVVPAAASFQIQPGVEYIIEAHSQNGGVTDRRILFSPPAANPRLERTSARSTTTQS